ncbi:MAG: hypothetical protein ABIC19_04675 [Patescibacteria group bacterium]|nr:hypothetical protein [Patescibacteria group bacterium]
MQIFGSRKRGLLAPPERFGILRNTCDVSLEIGSRIFNYSPPKFIYSVICLTRGFARFFQTDYHYPALMRAGDRQAVKRNSLKFQIILDSCFFIERALRTTLTDEKAIAAAAMAGFKSQPVKGYKTPAAKGMPTML